jgi:sugar phosphate permease
MWAPGLVGLTVGVLLLFGVRDSPESCGFPPVEVVAVKKKADGSEAPKEGLLSMLLNNVLKNPFIWGMALTYFFVYVVRQGVTSWFVFYLIKARPRFHPSSWVDPCPSSASSSIVNGCLLLEPLMPAPAPLWPVSNRQGFQP